MSTFFKRIPLGPVAEIVAAFLAMMALMRGFPGAKHDLGFSINDGMATNGRFSMSVDEALENCKLELRLKTRDITDEPRAMLGDVALTVDIGEEQDGSSRMFVIEGEDGGGWSWKAFDSLLLDMGQGQQEVEDWKLKCDKGTDSASARIYRIAWWWFTGGLYVLGIALSVLGAWRKKRREERGEKSATSDNVSGVRRRLEGVYRRDRGAGNARRQTRALERDSKSPCDRWSSRV